MFKPKQPIQMLHKRTRPVDPEVLKKDLRILTRFVKVYCNHHHHTPKKVLCDECADLLQYAEQRREKCPYDPKPACKVCPTHCYKPHYRQRIKEIMKYSGIYFVKRGRIDWLFKYFFSKAA